MDSIGGTKQYKTVQERLRENKIARFFNEYRRISTHIGEQFLRSGKIIRDENGNKRVLYYFMPVNDLKMVPENDVYSVCEEYFTLILEVVFDCYDKFKFFIDSRWYYTSDNFSVLGKTVEDAETELGFPRGWTDSGDPEDIKERWRALRSKEVGCEINHIFQKYLGKVHEQPC